ncbi:hypothetical protein pah_c003o046 [Parachlamydia acanthamoebae str. Hall's coccus]|jgi:hypothetical protein|nr:hypothetical protein pah_c003o046 [Parachlamydia acanthamoebae str. Hall's coccus]
MHQAKENLMKTLITRFLTLFVVVTGFCASIPDSAFAIHFGPIPGAEEEGHTGEHEKPEGEHPEE